MPDYYRRTRRLFLVLEFSTFSVPFLSLSLFLGFCPFLLKLGVILHPSFNRSLASLLILIEVSPSPSFFKKQLVALQLLSSLQRYPHHTTPSPLSSDPATISFALNTFSY